MAQQLSSLVQNTLAVDVTNITGTIPVLKGGTGATTAAAALTNLGAYAASNPSGYLTAETDTLATVTGRGASTTTASTFSGGLIASGSTAITLSNATNNYITSGTDVNTFIQTRASSAASTGSLSIFTGDSTFATGTAGNIAVYPGSGTTASGANISLTAGSVTAATSTGGYVLIRGGTALTTANTVGKGGEVYIVGGYAYAAAGTKTGGNVWIEGGLPINAGTNNPGTINIGTNNSGFNNTGSAAVNIGYSSITTTINGTVKLPNVGTSGFVKLGAGGQLSQDTSTYLTSYTETDTLAAVTARGATTTVVPTFSSGATIQGLTVGVGAGAVATNTAVGVSVLQANTTGSGNTAIGYQALYSNTGGIGNIASGRQALYSTTTGNNNTASGYQTLYSNLTGSNNIAIGVSALYSNTAWNNIAIGTGAGTELTTGANNVIIGSIAGTAGLSNTVIIAAGSAERMRIDSSGNVGIGGAPTTGVNLVSTKNITGAAIAGNIRSIGVIQSDVTNYAVMVDSIPYTQAASFTLGSLLHFRAVQGTIGAGSAVTTQYGYYVDSSLTGATNNFGFYGNIASGANRYNLYMAGTAANYLGGALTVAGQIESTVTGYKFPDGTVQATAATGGGAWEKITANTTATTKKQYVTDTTAAAFTVTLPASPAAGDYVYFMDAGNWATNNLTVARNGSTIEASATDLVLDVKGLMVQLIYDGTTWQVMSNIGPQGPIGPAQGVGKVIAMAMIFGG